jgi:hypothetical protein
LELPRKISKPSLNMDSEHPNLQAFQLALKAALLKRIAAEDERIKVTISVNLL